MSKELICYVEDEAHIQQLLKYNLESAGYRVFTFDDGETLLKTVKDNLPDLFVLDLMLPGIDGLEICRELRQNPKTRDIPIMMLTAKSEEMDKVIGLEIGADDYITKPFSIREFTSRVKALFRRVNNPSQTINEVISYGDITMDISRREVFKGDQLLDMPLKEFELLKLLIENKGKVLSRDILLEKIWGFDYYGETRTVDVHIRYLRQKIEENDSSPVYIETVRGIGYKFNDRAVHV
jgi:two-component system, OmpR family, alkaline phosphatase synthesis response regulator PhoP